MKSLLFLVIGLMTAVSAFADGPITLKAQSGEEIKIWYGFSSYVDGNTAGKYVTGVHIAVAGGLPGRTRVVLINSCQPSNQWTSHPYTITYDCNYGQDGTWLNSENCAINGPLKSKDGSSIVVWWANHGGETNCYQQVAISKVQNEWLVDPVSGEHNFNFRFPKQN
ncbi:MAG: hypothetical protein ACXVB1_09745 [Pseudobdellovibrionaceae bacterium]